MLINIIFDKLGIKVLIISLWFEGYIKFLNSVHKFLYDNIKNKYLEVGTFILYII